MRIGVARILTLSTLVMWSLVLSTAVLSMSANASTAYDGTYDFTSTGTYWNYYTSSWVTTTHTEDNFLVVTNGAVSNVYVASLYNWTNPPAGSSPINGVYWYTFTGTVDASGNANWVGGSFQGAGNLAYNYAGVIYTNGTGSGTWSKAGMEHGTWSIQRSGGLLLGSLSGVAPLVSAAVIVVSIVVIVIVATPLKVPTAPSPPSTVSPLPGWQPAWQGETGTGSPPAMPDGAVPVGGVGLHYASPPASGKPLPPRDYFSKTSQDPPRCPVHGDVALVAHYFKTDGSDPGSWFCPRCGNYPWGKS